jgi:hypothetical protein
LVGTKTVKITATDADSGVALVKFYIDGVLNDVLMHPFTGNEYRFVWNTTTAAEGSHTLKAVAFDNAGNSSTATVVVSVDNDPFS